MKKGGETKARMESEHRIGKPPAGKAPKGLAAGDSAKLSGNRKMDMRAGKSVKTKSYCG